ncbi:MAG: diguanylate cyclase [Lachnospiraceae bacterium]|nr:diguanylate cyclase [Lachnospiraceae bacterium]
MASEKRTVLPDNPTEIIEIGKKEKHKNAISKRLVAIVVAVMFILAVSSSLAIYFFTLNAILKEKELELAAISYLTASNIDEKIPGDYALLGDSSLRLYKGETDITNMSGLITETSSLLKVEISLIYSDTRILTTITDGDGKLITGIGLAPQIVSALNTSSGGVFFEDTLINSNKYFSYYYPLYNSDGSYAGAIECCSSYNSIMPTIRNNMIIFNLITVIATVILLLLISHFNQSLNKSVGKLLNFTQDAASGNDSALLDASLLRRKDEFGTIAGAVLEMHRSMRDMMDKDPLTKLYNRRSANRKLDIIMSHYASNGSSYSIAIGDIDFFKKVNDTYGHDAGDAVLQAVASILQENMKKNGFAARWGGEEFLLAFDKTDLDTAVVLLENILDEIRALTIDYEGREIKVTMSIGVASNPELSKDEIINEADARLYYSKENGRNRITAVLPE